MQSLHNALLGFLPGSPQAALAKARKKPRRRRPAPKQPRQAEQQYASAILRLLGALNEDARAMLLPAVRDMFTGRDRARRTDGVGDDIGALVARMMARFQTPRRAAVQQLAENVARSTANHAEKQLGRSIGFVPTVNPLSNPKVATRAQDFVAENVTLISSLPERYAETLSARVLRAYEDGTSYEELAAEISKVSDVVGYDAYRIARDQIGKLVADVRQERTQELGITQYVWRTAGDERVRDEHDALDGEVFDYAGPGAPGEGHPGDAIMCRCYDEPVIGD